MFRQLCFAAIAVFFAANTCSANFVIDDFTQDLSQPGSSPQLTITEMNAPVSFTYSAAFDTFSGTLDDGGMVSFAYDFSSLGGTLGSAAAMVPGSGTVFTGLSFGNLPALPVVGFDVMVSAVNSAFTPVTQAVSSSPTFVPISSGLEAADTIVIKFTNNTGFTTSFFFGGSTTPLVAVPEPTSLLMFSSVMGLAFVPRRRRR